MAAWVCTGFVFIMLISRLRFSRNNCREGDVLVVMLLICFWEMVVNSLRSYLYRMFRICFLSAIEDVVSPCGEDVHVNLTVSRDVGRGVWIEVANSEPVQWWIDSSHYLDTHLHSSSS
jgi:hypothetical protein